MPADAPTASAGVTGPAGLVGLEPVVGVAKPDPIVVADGVVRRFGGVTAVTSDGDRTTIVDAVGAVTAAS